ncbi:hypothetical protein CCMA1212_009636 [Trichoderma ghanense]|uniref:Uncharacterized protein n=1 Tax=Trichoderma ghanense TaxID=65468 RepID=A0ABY2GRG7_9HYPO
MHSCPAAQQQEEEVLVLQALWSKSSTPSNPDGLDGEDNQRIRSPKPQTETADKTPGRINSRHYEPVATPKEFESGHRAACNTDG